MPVITTKRYAAKQSAARARALLKRLSQKTPKIADDLSLLSADIENYQRDLYPDMEDHRREGLLTRTFEILAQAENIVKRIADVAKTAVEKEGAPPCA